ncbi:hypothetical protein V3G39_09220 [Dermatophilaceae bacterium Sec6.4]
MVGIGEAFELIVGVLLVLGLLLFVMAWLESTMHEPIGGGVDGGVSEGLCAAPGADDVDRG